MSPNRAPVRVLIAEIAIPILLVCALDVGLGRYMAESSTAPIPMLFNSPFTSSKVLAFRERARREDRLDVLLLGLSPMMRVNGAQLHTTLTERAQRAVSTFNFSGPFHSVAVDLHLLRDVILPFLTPAVVVYGVSPIALLSENRTAAEVDAWLAEFPLFGMYTGSPVERLRGTLLMHVNLLQYREVIRASLSPPGGWKGGADRALTLANANGDVPLLTEHHPVRALNQWERDYQAQFADFDGVLQRTLLFEHLAELASFCKERGIQLMLLNHPIHPLFLEVLPGGRHDYERFLTRLRETARRAAVPLFEPVPDGIGPPDLYQDIIHNDAAGGTWLTQVVARYLLDRWYGGAPGAARISNTLAHQEARE